LIFVHAHCLNCCVATCCDRKETPFTNSYGVFWTQKKSVMITVAFLLMGMELEFALIITVAFLLMGMELEFALIALKSCISLSTR
jgi:hypothetical protein